MLFKLNVFVSNFQENVLLDKDQNLKLIDFGLCARPEGGVHNPLYTSCGSPTYAAPELVLGKQYLGPEVDVWAMGVLLYTLLAGFLPFSDDKIDCLYKKILSGKYEEPFFMSNSSKQLIRQMLQVDPKKRITVKELLSHPWLTMGVLNTVEYYQENSKHRDDECIEIIANYLRVSAEEVWRHLKKWKYDYNTANYLLLQLRKKKHLPLRLLPIANKVPIITSYYTDSGITKREVIFRALENNMKNIGTPIAYREEVKSKGESEKNRINCTPEVENYKSPCVTLKPEELHTPPMKVPEPLRPKSTRKPYKRLRSPTLDGDCSPGKIYLYVAA